MQNITQLIELLKTDSIFKSSNRSPNKSLKGFPSISSNNDNKSILLFIMIKLKLFFNNVNIKYADDKTKSKYEYNEDMIPINLFLRHLKHVIVDTEEEADYILFNMYGNIKPKHFIKNSGVYSKKVIVIWITDKEDPIDDSQFIIFRTSLHKSTKKPNEYSFPWCTPYNWERNYYSIDNKPFENVYTNSPTIGFCGQVNSVTYGGKIRNDTMNCISKRDYIDSTFIRRDAFIRSYSGKEQQQYRGIDYIQNLKFNMFSLAIRGGGNWSLRFFEIMAYGRIPVLLDTDCVLPFENLIDWNEVIIMSSDVNQLCLKMNQWHSKGSDFIFEKQNQCRYIWEEYLSLEGFGKNIINIVR